jgi:hypothetical protein
MTCAQRSISGEALVVSEVGEEERERAGLTCGGEFERNARRCDVLRRRITTAWRR